MLNKKEPVIAVFMGGGRASHAASLSSGQGLVKAIESLPYRPIPVTIDATGQWQVGADAPVTAVEALGASDGPWLTALLLEGKKFEDPREALTRSLKSLELSAQRRERAALEREVLDMLEGRRTRDEDKILRYQTLTRILRATPPAGPSDR